MPTVTLEVVSWLAKALGSQESGRLVRHEEVQTGATVRDLFDRLASENQEFARYIYDQGRQSLTGHVTVIVNDRILDLLNGLDTEINDGDTVLLLPAFSGGS